MTDVHNGYLELDYHLYPYLTDLLLHSRAVQIEKVIVDPPDDINMNVQTERFLDKGYNLGSQTERVIDAIDSLGTQVRLMIIDPPDDIDLGTQVERILKKINNIGTQVERMIIDPPDDINMNVQVERMIIDPPDDINMNVQVDRKLSPTGQINTQIEKVLDKLNTVGVQTEKHVIYPPDDVNMSTQILRYILPKENHGVQVWKTNLEHHVCPYYLNTFSYLTTPYHAGCINAKLMTQIDKKVTHALNNVGSQIERLIVEPPDDVNLGTQIERKLEKILEIGSQVEKKLTYVVPIGTQIERFISLGLVFGVQTEKKLNKFRSVGTQINRVSASTLSVQVNRRLYNITQLRILDVFLNRGTVAQQGNTWTNEIVNGIAQGDYSVNNLNTDLVEQITKTAPAERRFKIYCNTGIPNTFVDTIAILNHNFTASAVVEVVGFKDIADFNAGIPTIVIRPVVEQDNIYWISPDLPLNPAQYWRFEIQDTGNPYQLQMGTIVFGTSRIMTVAECFDNPVTFGFKHFKDSVETEGFTNFSLDRALRRNLSLTFAKLRYYGGNYLMIKEFFLNVKTDLKALVIPRPTKPSSLAVFAKLNQLPSESHEAINDEEHYISFNLDWDEAN
jgi:hypothetical protein